MGMAAEFLFDISKSVDMYLSTKGISTDVYMEDMPYTVLLSASTVIQIKSFVSADLLYSLTSGAPTFSIKSSVDHALGTILTGAQGKIRMDSAALAAEIRSLLGKVTPSIQVQSETLETLVSVMSGAAADIKVEAKLLDSFVRVCSGGSSKITVGSTVDNGILRTEIIGTDSDVLISSSLGSDILYSSVELPAPCTISVASSAGRVLVAYYRTVADCTEFTIADLDSMTLKELYLTEL